MALSGDSLASSPRVLASTRRIPWLVLVALLPIWLVGLFDRGFWTPDEPREADIAWRMSFQPDKTLPRLAGTPFLEKPPLSYWMAGGSIRLFGDSPAAARLPNLLYALVTALAIATLTSTMTANASAAILAALVAGSAITAFRVATWLAPDACLLAGCAVALLGAYAGYCSAPGRRKLIGYTLMHVGAAVGFMAKSAPGWLVPAIALLTLIAWERRWTELARWELYVGFVLQAAVIAPWIVAVLHTPQGTDALATLFWNNIVGRFTKLSAPAALDYTTGHQNSPGKYVLELPVYLLPWTLLAIAALRRAWDRARATGATPLATGSSHVATGTAWRFAVCATLPLLALLSVAATARDIYAAPVLLGFALLIGLWSAEAPAAPNVLDVLAFRGTRVLVGLIAALFAAALAVLALSSAPGASAIYLSAGAVAVLVTTFLALRSSALAQRRGAVYISVGWTYVAFATALFLTAATAFPTVDGWQDLPSIARKVHTDTEHNALALLDPDETTIAMLDRELLTPFTTLSAEPSQPATPDERVLQWFNAHGQNARVLVLLPGHASGPVTRLFEGARPAHQPGDGIAGSLVSEGIASIVARYELPQGRRYALLGPLLKAQRRAILAGAFPGMVISRARCDLRQQHC